MWRRVGEGRGRPNPSPPLQDLNILPSWPLASWRPAVGPSLVAGWPRTSLGKPNRSLFSSVWRPPIPWPVLADAPARTLAPSPQHPLLCKSSRQALLVLSLDSKCLPGRPQTLASLFLPTPPTQRPDRVPDFCYVKNLPIWEGCPSNGAFAGGLLPVGCALLGPIHHLLQALAGMLRAGL